MGRSVTCTYAVHVNLSNGKKILSTQSCYGAMNLKQARGIMLSEQNYQKEKGISVVNIEIWPQTQRGRNSMRGKDYAIMNVAGKIDYYNIDEPVPMYCF
jgi:hypothetical protein